MQRIVEHRPFRRPIDSTACWLMFTQQVLETAIAFGQRLEADESACALQRQEHVGLGFSAEG